MNRLTRILMLAFIMLLLVSSFVAAWGVIPARQIAPYLEETQSLKVMIRNTDYQEGYFVVKFGGELGAYAQYKGPTIYLSPEQEQYTIPFTLTVPAGLEPGKKELLVELVEVEGERDDVTVSSLLSLVAEVIVTVPQQGNFITARAFIEPKSESDAVPITISILNRGDDIVSVYADIEITNPTGQRVASWTTDPIILEYLGNGKIVTKWPGQKQAGLYYANISLVHDGKITKLNEPILIGTKEVVSQGISSLNFALGEIVQLNITAVNKWNDVMKDVYADVLVFSQEGQLVQQFKSTPEDIQANAKKDLVAYWNTFNLVTGYYNLNVLMNYPGGSSTNNYGVIVSEDNLEISNEVTGQVIREETPGNMNGVFIILLIVLIVTNVVIILYFKKMRGGKS